MAILAASTISVEIGISVALIELGLGVVVGNALDVSVPGWLAFAAATGGSVLVASVAAGLLWSHVSPAAPFVLGAAAAALALVLGLALGARDLRT